MLCASYKIETLKSMRQILLIFILIIFLTNANSQEKQKTLNPDKLKSGNVTNPSESKIQKMELVLSKSLEDKLSAKLESRERTFLDKYGAVLVAIVALIGTLITTLIGTRHSRINLQNQLIASERNLNMQIQANRELEKEKKLIESEHKKNIELKALVADFIKRAISLNNDLYKVIDLKSRWSDAQFKYQETEQLRRELRDIYYSIKVTLDDSKNQSELEKILDNYLNKVDFRVDLPSLSKQMIEEPIGQIYHKMKSIIHPNYKEIK